MEANETVKEAAERIYREYPTNPLDKPDWHYNRDIHCYKKRKAFINGAKWQKEQLKTELKEAREMIGTLNNELKQRIETDKNF